MTIQEAIDAILRATGADRLDDTVDTAKTGDPGRPLRGIVTTFMPTATVLARATELGANLVIPHEPVFYNHRDEADFLADDPVYQAKRRLIDEGGIVVWRFHDYWHRTRPDGILTGVLRQLGWQREGEHERPCIVPVAPTTLWPSGCGRTCPEWRSGTSRPGIRSGRSEGSLSTDGDDARMTGCRRPGLVPLWPPHLSIARAKRERESLCR